MICVNSISVSPSILTLQVGQWYYCADATVYPTNADCKGVSWRSENTNIATVNASSGYIYAKAIGTTKIYATATDGSGQSDYITVTVAETIPVTSVALNKIGLSLKKGNCTTLEATVYPGNATNKTLNWDSSDPDIVSVDSNGRLCAHEYGTAIITVTATDGSDAYDNCTVWVTADVLATSITVVPACYTMLKGQSAFPRALMCPGNVTNNGVVWSSSDPTIAIVTSNDGHIQALKEGTVTITATAQDGSGVYGTCTITVKEIHAQSIVVCPENVTIGIGEVAILHAYPCPENTTDEISWRSDTSHAEVNNGVVRGISGGEAMITAKLPNSVSASCLVTVDPRPKVVVKDVHEYDYCYKCLEDYSVIIFPETNEESATQWRIIGCDLLLDENKSKKDINIPEEYPYLFQPERNYLFNRQQYYTVQQLAFVYLFDPLGVEYYMKNFQYATNQTILNNYDGGKDGNINLRKRLLFKDDLYTTIFGETSIDRFCFEFSNTGELHYFLNGSAGKQRDQYYTNAETLFGFHDDYDSEEFWDRFLKTFFQKMIESIPGYSVLELGAQIYQVLFFSGSIAGLGSDLASSYIEDYVSGEISDMIEEEIGETATQVVSWFANLRLMIAKSAVTAFLDGFMIPNNSDIKIYKKIENQSNYRLILNTTNQSIPMKDVIAYCGIEE